jgi:DNA-binding PadR family transcriptional regulator
VLTTADLVVLSLLAEQPMHGYDLLAEYNRQEVVDWASVSKAQLYYALAKLADRGLIAGQSEADGARERVVYSQTAEGRRALAAALAEDRWASERVAQPFATWLGLSIHAEAGATRDLLERRRDWLVAELARERSSLAYIETLTTDRAKRGSDIVRLVIRQLEVEHAWVCELLARDQTDEPAR